MTDTAHMKAALQRYIDAFNARDVEGIVALYAPDATVEDPVGKDRLQGHERIRAFYAGAMAGGAVLKLVAPIRGSHGDAAAMAFEAHVESPQGKVVVRVIDIMRFDAAGRIVSMQAYWGPDDMSFTPV